MKKSPLLFVAIATSLLLTGCLSLRLGFGGGSSKNTTTENKSAINGVTLGQQLIDLQKAYDEGIITESEYKAQKKKILRQK